MSEKRDRSSWDRRKKPVSANDPDLYDQVRAYLVGESDEQLTGEAKRLAELAPQVWQVMLTGVSSKETVQMMQDQGLAGSYREAVGLITQVEKVYGRVKEADQKGRRALLVEILLDTIRKAQQEKDFPIILRATQQIAKMEGLNLDGEEGTNIYQQLVLPTPTLSSDPLTVTGVEIAGIDEQYD